MNNAAESGRPPADICSVAGCGKKVPKPGHTVCYEHWKTSAKPPTTWLSSTTLGEKLGLSAQRLNHVLRELGWIEKNGKGWTASEQGLKLCAEVKKANNGISYTVWPEAILSSRILTRAIAELIAPESTTTEIAEKKAAYGNDFRKRFPATHRTTDGHMVRSRAEVMIDDWLYATARLPHAYERRVPIEEDLYCDFYLPERKVYVEYWGMENDPQYLARKQEKLALYAKYGLNLVEINDDHIKNLDDHLPRLLLKFGIDVD
ncbi:MAG: hypothetical protein Q7S85_00220 [Rugosibacter sp.]|nr:hypothetical protein [Rugosibacter sp.]